MMINSIDVIKPLIAYTEQDKFMPDFQVIGGVNSAALEHKDTIIDFDGKEVIAPNDLQLPTIRDNGTLRDLDVLVLSSDPSAIKFVEMCVEDKVGDSLEVSVFGFKSADTLRQQLNQPLGLAAVKVFLSDRYETSDVDEQQGSVEMLKSLFPFAAPIDPESLETWTLSVGDMHVPIPNPAMSVINYTNRSISGLRPKDVDKVKSIAEMVFCKSPQLREWVIDGPGSSQTELGLLLRSLTPNKEHIDLIGIGKKILPMNDLAKSELFMLREMNSAKKRQILAVAALKANILAFGESNPGVVKWWQESVESLIDDIVKNN